MDNKKFIINGNNFSNLDEFYNEVEKVLTKDLKEFGRNLDAFDDILWGGFGKFEYEEPIALIWKNAEKSRRDLNLVKDDSGATLFDVLIGIIKNHHHIQLVFEK